MVSWVATFYGDVVYITLPHAITTQKTMTSSFIAVKTLNFTLSWLTDNYNFISYQMLMHVFIKYTIQIMTVFLNKVIKSY
jgi:hypothetical protein